ncbi:hypothetical protein, partial [Bacillus paralicheniformis]|uniref:hypothetical protein n=1 Tax=Bacillus paralicheniformis TaxID=1648923 RepID=UPI00227F476D
PVRETHCEFHELVFFISEISISFPDFTNIFKPVKKRLSNILPAPDLPLEKMEGLMLRNAIKVNPK